MKMRPPGEPLNLAEQIRKLEANDRQVCGQELSTPLLEAMFERKLFAGSLVELLAETAGSGAWTLGLSVALQACLPGKTLVIVDGQRCFYPPAAAALGLDLDHTILVRPASWQEALTAIRESLRCPAVGSTLGWFERLSTNECRQLQLAAECGGGIGVLLRPGSRIARPFLRNAAPVRQTRGFPKHNTSNARRSRPLAERPGRGFGDPGGAPCADTCAFIFPPGPCSDCTGCNQRCAMSRSS